MAACKTVILSHGRAAELTLKASDSILFLVRFIYRKSAEIVVSVSVRVCCGHLVPVKEPVCSTDAVPLFCVSNRSEVRGRVQESDALNLAICHVGMHHEQLALSVVNTGEN